MKSIYDVRIATAEEFSASRDAWNGVVRRMRYPTPFAVWEWIYTWWEHLGRESTALPIFVYRGGELRAILPVFNKGRNDAGWPKAAALDYGGGDDLFADHLDIVCAPDETEACGSAVLTFLANEYRDWDVVRIPMIAEDGGLRKVCWLGSEGLMSEWNPRSIAPYTPLPASFEDFMAQLPRKDRHTVRSLHRRAVEEGAQYKSFSGTGASDGLSHVFALHEKRALQKGIDSTFMRPEAKRFHFALLGRLPAEQLMLRALCIGEEVIASLYAFRVGNRIFLYQLGYDPRWSRLSPGVAIITESIREAIEGGCMEYNFLQGDEPYKRNWARRSRKLLQLRLYNKTLPGRCLHAGARAKHFSVKAIRRWLPRFAGASERRGAITV